MPDAGKVSGVQGDVDAVEFSSHAEVVYQHDGVGSGELICQSIHHGCLGKESALKTALHTYTTVADCHDSRTILTFFSCLSPCRIRICL